MSKENVALFLKAISEKKPLNAKVAQAPKTPQAWVDLGKGEGLQFSSADLHTFVKEVIDLKDLKAEASVEALLAAIQPRSGELSDEQMESVAAGALTGGALAFDQSLYRRLNTLGYPGIGGDVAQYIEMPPMHIQTSSLPGMDRFRM